MEGNDDPRSRSVSSPSSTTAKAFGGGIANDAIMLPDHNGTQVAGTQRSNGWRLLVGTGHRLTELRGKHLSAGRRLDPDRFFHGYRRRWTVMEPVAGPGAPGGGRGTDDERDGLTDRSTVPEYVQPGQLLRIEAQLHTPTDE